MSDDWAPVGKCQVCSANLFQNGSGSVQDAWSGYDCIAYYPSDIGMGVWKPNKHRLAPKTPAVNPPCEVEFCVGFYDPVLGTWQVTDTVDFLEEARELRNAYCRMAVVHDTVHVLEKKSTFDIIDC